MKYKFALIILLAICFTFIIENSVVIKSINLKKYELSKLDKSIYTLKTIKKIDYSKIIDSLKQIKGINILNFESNKEKDKITAVIEVRGNKKTIEYVLKRIENINGFYNIDNMEISEFENKKMSAIAVIYVSFI
ncbi:hypothetical protein ACSVC9_05530 [Clostridium sp. LBM24168]